MVCWLVVFVVIIAVMIVCWQSKENYTVFDSPKNVPVKSDRYFQFQFPSVHVENRYHKFMFEDCNGDYENYQCRQKAYIKAMKDGTTDKADLICSRYKDEDQYYNCLDAVYGNYLWEDRSVGVDRCLCQVEGGSYTGALAADGSCYCPPFRSLDDRRSL